MLPEAKIPRNILARLWLVVCSFPHCTHWDWCASVVASRVPAYPPQPAECTCLGTQKSVGVGFKFETAAIHRCIHLNRATWLAKQVVSQWVILFVLLTSCLRRKCAKVLAKKGLQALEGQGHTRHPGHLQKMRRGCQMVNRQGFQGQAQWRPAI
eukprot:1738073-Karenia_brevis.AAC.1